MIHIDGSSGEGGGQILRTSITLSMITGKPVRIEKIRAGRKKPGLMRQHLTAVSAAAEISGARVEGAETGSQNLVFVPGKTRAGNYRFAVGTAGSTTLVFQTVLPALLVSDGPSTIELEGGTHNPMAPTFDFLEKAFFPALEKMGCRVNATLHRHGFFPAGGGRFSAEILPSAPQVISLEKRSEMTRKLAVAMVSKIPGTVAERELEVIKEKLGWPDEYLQIRRIEDSPGPGNIVSIETVGEGFSEVFTGFGERGVAAEKVANQAAAEARAFIAAGVPVGSHLADQLLVPMTMAGGGRFRTVNLTRHTTTNIDVIRRFVDVRITTRNIEKNVVEVGIGSLARGDGEK